MKDDINLRMKQIEKSIKDNMSRNTVVSDKRLVRYIRQKVKKVLDKQTSK